MKVMNASELEDGEEYDGKTIRSRLTAKLDRGDCVEAFYKSVNAYLDKPDLPRRLSHRQEQVRQLAFLILGDELRLNVPDASVNC